MEAGSGIRDVFTNNSETMRYKSIIDIQTRGQVDAMHTTPNIYIIYIYKVNVNSKEKVSVCTTPHHPTPHTHNFRSC